MADHLKALGECAAALLAPELLEPWRVAGVIPRAVILPENAAEVSSVLQYATSARLPIEPAGSGTWLLAGRRPAAQPIVISTQRLNQIAEYEPADLTVSLGAGVRVADFQCLAAEHRQWIALDAPGFPEATIGAVVSSASAGPVRYAYGVPRDQVLGLELVTGDGTIMNLGGKVVKNVAGYDLTRLATGSRGTLGVITRVNMRLRPVPVHDVTFAFYGEPRDLSQLSILAGSATLEAAAIELLIREGSDPDALYVRVQGNEQTVRSAAAELERATSHTPFVLSESEASAIWSHLNDVAATAQVNVRLAALPTENGRLVDAAHQIRDALEQWLIAMHAGNGIARIYGVAVTDRDEFVRALQEARTALADVRGSVLVTVLPPGLHGDIQLFDEPGAEVRLMRDLKSVFDPAQIMAPGRFLV
jgi:glycolate oxidase FAD binding subunit